MCCKAGATAPSKHDGRPSPLSPCGGTGASPEGVDGGDQTGERERWPPFQERVNTQKIINTEPPTLSLGGTRTHKEVTPVTLRWETRATFCCTCVSVEEPHHLSCRPHVRWREGKVCAHDLWYRSVLGVVSPVPFHLLQPQVRQMEHRLVSAPVDLPEARLTWSNTRKIICNLLLHPSSTGFPLTLLWRL